MSGQPLPFEHDDDRRAAQRRSTRKKPRGMRLFIAAYPPAPIAERFANLLDEVELPKHRRTAAEQIHLTLQFIGNVEKKDVDAMIESIERSASGIGALTLTPEALIALPQRGRKRVIAVETDRPAGLVELHQRLVTRLAREPRGDSHRTYRPHLTIARINPPSNVSLPPVDVVDLSHTGFEVASIQLMRSLLTPQGAEHRLVHDFPLASRHA